jgi:hypothetical protein
MEWWGKRENFLVSSWVIIYHPATHYAIIPVEILLRLWYKKHESEGELGKNERENNITKKTWYKTPPPPKKKETAFKT